MNTPRILGIDIGAAGALALITPSGDLLEVGDMPILRDGPKNRATVNGPLLAEIVYRWHVTEAFVEHVSARPGEGAVGAFAFGRLVASSRAFWPRAGFRCALSRRRAGSASSA